MRSQQRRAQHAQSEPGDGLQVEEQHPNGANRSDRLNLPDPIPEACSAPDCDLDPSIHICTGIWMGRTIIDRRCLKLDSDGLRGGGTHQASTDIL